MSDRSDTLLALEAAATRYRERRAGLERELRARLLVELEQDGIRRDILAHRARVEGRSVGDIAEALGVSRASRSVAYAAIENGSRYNPDDPTLTPRREERAEFALSGDTLIVTPDADTIAPILQALELAQAPDSAPFQAAFRVDSDGVLEPITPAWTEEGGRNPVVALVQAPGGAYLRRIREWLAPRTVTAS